MNILDEFYGHKDAFNGLPYIFQLPQYREIPMDNRQLTLVNQSIHQFHIFIVLDELNCAMSP